MNLRIIIQDHEVERELRQLKNTAIAAVIAIIMFGVVLLLANLAHAQGAPQPAYLYKGIIAEAVKG